jgi:hypothetical protein
VGGQLALGVGALLGWGLHRWNQNRLDDRHERRCLQAQAATSAESSADRTSPTSDGSRSTGHTEVSADVPSAPQG